MVHQKKHFMTIEILADFDGLGLTYKISELRKAFEDLTLLFYNKIGR